MRTVNLAKPHLVAVDWFLENEVLHRVQAGRIFLSNIQNFNLPGEWGEQSEQVFLCMKNAEAQLETIIRLLREEDQ